MAIKKESEAASKTLAEARIPQKIGLIVIAVKKEESGQFIYNPSSQTILEPGDEIIVLGHPENIIRLKGYTG